MKRTSSQMSPPSRTRVRGIPAVLSGTASSVPSVRGAQNSIFCRRHSGECAAKFSRPELSRPVPEVSERSPGPPSHPAAGIAHPPLTPNWPVQPNDQHDRTHPHRPCLSVHRPTRYHRRDELAENSEDVIDWLLVHQTGSYSAKDAPVAGRRGSGRGATGCFAVPGPQGVGQPFEVRHGHGERRVATSAKR
jgi:hypothetical protein